MANLSDELIQQALSAARSGNKGEAKRILSESLKQNPRDARVWYLLSQVVENPEQQIQCLEKAQQLQPDNPQIKAKLENLKRPAPLHELNLYIPPQQQFNSIDPQKKKTAWWVWALLILTVPILGCMCLGMFSALVDPSGDVGDPFKLTHEVVYRIEGNASSAMITYMNEQGGMEQINSAKLPWIKTYEMNNGASTSLLAQSNNDGRTITCIIELDGKEWKRSSSSGAYVVVTCSGWIGLE